MKLSGLQDSGARAATLTGGMREPSNGLERGRYDLIPAECLAAVYRSETLLPDCLGDAILSLCNALMYDCNGFAEFARYMLATAGSMAEGVRRLAVHYARGAVKYDARNWEKGVETGRCVDSLFRHLTQWQAGLTDEDHLAAVIWNTFALMWLQARIRAGALPKELDTYGLPPKDE